MRRIGFVLAVAAAIVAGVASASAVVGGASTTTNGPDAIQPDGRGSRLPATTADPDGRASWGVRIYQSKTGLTCPEAGRTRNGAFGRIDNDNTFTPLDLEAAGSCADLSREPLSLAINHFPAKGKIPARAVIFGATTSQVSGLVVQSGDERRPVPIAGNAYITVAREDALPGGRLLATLADGSVKAYDLPPSTAPAVEPAAPEAAG
jgi:hypothetical protein